MEHYTLPRLFVSDGTIEVMKWLALLSMTSDHVTKQPPAKASLSESALIFSENRGILFA